MTLPYSTDKITSRWTPHIPENGAPVSGTTWVFAVLEDNHHLPAMQAMNIDWDCPGDQVIKWRFCNKGRVREKKYE